MAEKQHVKLHYACTQKLCKEDLGWAKEGLQQKRKQASTCTGQEPFF